MSDDIKIEFKDFIAALSTEICEKVLLEELKKVNTSLNDTSNKYNELYINYKSNIEQIKQELNKLDDTNKNMNFFTNSINANNKVVNESLSIVKNVQKNVLQDILNKNNQALEKYKIDIQKLNCNEREEFIKALSLSIKENSKVYLDELSCIVNGSKMNQTLINTEEINKCLKSTKSEISLVKSNIDKLGKDIILKNEKEYKNTCNSISDIEKKIKLISNDLKDSDEVLKSKIVKLEQEIQLKNKIIIGINIFILILLFFKN